MLELLGIALLALLILVSIALHELGHLLPAKRFGVKVTDYMVGFGPTVWSTRRGETRYGLKAIPLGGFIRMVGMLPPASALARQGSTAGTSHPGRFAGMMEQARRDSAAGIGPGEDGRSFYRLPVRRKLVVMLGGPLMNLLLAVVLFAVMLVGVGVPQPTTTVSAVVPCVPTVQHPLGVALASGSCPSGTDRSPAALAGLEPGDTVVSVAGVPVGTWEAMSSQFADSAGQSVTLVVRRDGSLLDVPLVVASMDRPQLDEQGVVTGQAVTSGFVGLAPRFDYVPQGWSDVPSFMWQVTARSVQGLLLFPLRLYELVTGTLIGGAERSLDSPVSVVGVSRLGGEVAAMDEPLRGKAATFLGLAASLNLFLFLFNLLPVLPLDGGHVASALYEGARRRLAQLRGRPDPGPVDVARMLPVAHVVAVVLLAVGLVVIWADLVRPISLG